MSKRKKRGAPPGPKVKSAFLTEQDIVPFSVPEGDTYPAITGTCLPMSLMERATWFSKFKAMSKSDGGKLLEMTADFLMAHLRTWDLPVPLDRDGVGRLRDTAAAALINAIQSATEVRQKN